jgi:uncharacterized protein (UPF0332 family)
VTREQKKLAIDSEIARGRDSLQAARLLLTSELHADAVSRAYYAALHFARALLLLNSEEPRTHSGVLRLLSRDFVREKRLDPELARQLSLLEKQRSDADYTAEMVFTRQGAEAALCAAELFIDAATRILAED